MDSRKIISATAGRAANALGLDVVQSGYTEKAGNGDKPDTVEVVIKLKGTRESFITATAKNGPVIVDAYIEELADMDSDKLKDPDFMQNWQKELGLSPGRATLAE